jgi:hypothetical protein
MYVYVCISRLYNQAAYCVGIKILDFFLKHTHTQSLLLSVLFNAPLAPGGLCNFWAWVKHHITRYVPSFLCC